jgi:CheY-like chemotaxis protein
MRYFAALFLRMALAGTTALVCAKATEVASQETARGITDQRVKTMKIRMDVEGTVIMATLDDNETPWGRDCVLVAVTGWGHEDDRRRAFDAGFDHHLTKPLAANALESLVNSVSASLEKPVKKPE